jgi:hypothetical protein
MTSNGLPALPDGRQQRAAPPADNVDLSGYQRGVVATLAQVATAGTARIAQHVAPLMAQRAEDLTRAAYYSATADLMLAALRTCLDGVYESCAGVVVGHEPDGRINVAVPWSKASHKRYALRRHQADLLAAIVRIWQLEYTAGRYPRPAVFLESKATRRWYIDLASYPTYDAASRALVWIDAGYVRSVELALRNPAGI